MNGLALSDLKEYSLKGQLDLYTRFFKTQNFLKWILNKSDRINLEWEDVYMRFLGSELGDRVCSRAVEFGWSDPGIIDLFARIFQVIVSNPICFV